MTLKVLILGAGGHAQVVADILWRMYEIDRSVQPVGYLDDNASLWNKRLLDVPVLGATEDLGKLTHDAVIIAIGDNRIRCRLKKKLERSGEKFTIARHPSAVIAPDVIIEPGTMICAGVVVNTGSKVGAHVILNTSSTIDHHNEIGDCVHIAPGAHLGGEVTIKEGAFVGIGSTIIPRIRIGDWSMIGAGSVVTKNIHPNVTAVGVPARPIKHHTKE